MTQSTGTQLDEILFPAGTEFAQGDKLSVLVDQYRLFVDSSEKLVARRQTVNNFFLSVNALLLSVVGFIIKNVSQQWANIAAVLAVGMAGILICITWRTLVRSHRQLNAGKFAVIHSLEQHLPAALFKAEWYALGEGQDKRKYTPFTKSEALIPIVFIVLYTLAMIGSVVQRVPW